ncbi:hypothetical protein GCM10025792_13210 [Pseudonocardia tropica]
MGEHVVEPDYGDGQDEHDPEQPLELPDVIAVTVVSLMLAVPLRTGLVMSRVLTRAGPERCGSRAALLGRPGSATRRVGCLV